MGDPRRSWRERPDGVPPVFGEKWGTLARELVPLVAVLVLWVVLAGLAPELFAFLARLGRWGG